MKQLHIRFRVLTLLIIGLLCVAGIYGVYSVSTYGNRWFSSARNTRYRSARSSVIKGTIVDRNRVVLASTDAQGNRVYQGDALSRSAIVHLIGDEDGFVANGVDSFQANYLLGFETSLSERVTALLKGETRQGDNIMLTVDSRLCTGIATAFDTGGSTKGKGGAAVVMNYRTGEVLALVSFPIFDPANLDDAVKNNPQHPFWNRALQSTLPPGSIFKIVTTAASLQTMPDAKEHVYECMGELAVVDTMNRLISDYHKAKHGDIQLERAFTVSCNCTFAQISLMVGDTAMRKTAEAFGFNDNFLFRDLVVENSTYPTKNRNDFEIAWSGAGQSRITVTPMHMCMLASAIANNGVMMEPRLIGRVQSPTGVVRQQYFPKQYTQALDSVTAKTIAGYMKNVVQKGTGTAAGVSGLSIAGKTGSAESSVNGKPITYAWFIGYIDDPSLPYACSILVEGGNTGGSVAAPIASKIFSYLKTYYKK